MKIVVLDGYTENPGDLSWDALKELGDVTVYDRTSYEESPLIAERIGDAEIVIINKTPISKETIDKCPNMKLIAVLATGYNVVDYNYAKELVSMLLVFFLRSVLIMVIMMRLLRLANGRIMMTGATGIIR